MTRLLVAAIGLALGVAGAAAGARDLQVEVTVLHVGGLLDPAEFEAMLADERVAVEAHYEPVRLIEGETARRERTMPFGSRLFAITRQVELRGERIERHGRTLRLRATDEHPEHDGYRLSRLFLRVPVAPGTARPQPGLHLSLMHAAPKSGAREEAFLSGQGAFDLGLRVRARWSGTQGEAVVATPACDFDVEPLGGGEYRFRPRHRLAGLFRFLAPTVQSDPPSRPPAGQRSFRMRPPFPEPLEGWPLSRNHLVQVQAGGTVAERLSVYGTQQGPGSCRRSLLYEALFAGGQLVAAQRSTSESECRGEGVYDGYSVEAHWLDDGSLARFIASTQPDNRAWDGFLAARPGCATGVAPSAGEVRALGAELHRLREAFLR